MPSVYARTFDVSEAAVHADIVARRGDQLVHAEICAGRNGAQVCLITDDRPGLLALVTDALLVHGFRIRNAQVYCRQRRDGRSEAVDFFQLQTPDAAPNELGIGASELAALVQTVSELVAEDALANARPSVPPPSGRPVRRVYFELDALPRGEFVLIVEAPDSEGLLNAISNALRDQQVHIISSEINTEHGAVRDRFELASNDGQPLDAVRLGDIQQAVLAALPSSVRRA